MCTAGLVYYMGRVAEEWSPKLKSRGCGAVYPCKPGIRMPELRRPKPPKNLSWAPIPQLVLPIQHVPLPRLQAHLPAACVQPGFDGRYRKPPPRPDCCFTLPKKARRLGVSLTPLTRALLALRVALLELFGTKSSSVDWPSMTREHTVWYTRCSPRTC